MAEAKKPDMKEILKGAAEAKLAKTPVKKESASVSDRTKLMGNIKNPNLTKLDDASELLKKAEEQTMRATKAAYKAAKAEKKSA
mmetsp:Transcript_14302/g.28850  ORF Transcript_14302/g.28850 Transcript_14302/m.28850 type:complete len:84 (-) Transcript_14302:311-562(-)|eukprot:CAMPEP_0167789476 /NCGR_PEP_ID=MMETSP0111_2-20121227/10710_1 /TAXON_ID=91324 /ORGANISM="Lotharella globosa, Strain CCCM811" /LENGTH=83 /DNA_ID=CAMNT_0007681655 /DNA_START=96 /DNA_END=347 /DNA_ORIENTATION=+